MKRLTREEDQALNALMSKVARILGPSWMRKARRNPAPDRITVEPGHEVRMMLDVNGFLMRALNMLSKKAEDSPRDPIMKRDVATFMGKVLRTLSRRIKDKLTGPKPIHELYITGDDAKLYYGVLEWGNSRWGVILKNYIETATDLNTARDHSKRVLWIVRSLLKTGHPPR